MNRIIISGRFFIFRFRLISSISFSIADHADTSCPAFDSILANANPHVPVPNIPIFKLLFPSFVQFLSKHKHPCIVIICQQANTNINRNHCDGVIK